MLFFGIRLRHFRIDGLFIIPKMPNQWGGDQLFFAEYCLTCISYFKSLAEETGIPYQTLINLYLRDGSVQFIPLTDH